MDIPRVNHADRLGHVSRIMRVVSAVRVDPRKLFVHVNSIAHQGQAGCINRLSCTHRLTRVGLLNRIARLDHTDRIAYISLARCRWSM